MFNWDDVKVFLAVTRERTVRGAARELGVTHATVSRRLRGLEDKLGSQLFERTSDGQVLTPMGLEILSVAEQVEEKIGEIDRRAFAQDKRLSGMVRLSVSDSLFLSVLHPCVKSFQTQFPMIEIELISTHDLSSLSRRHADIVVRITKKPPESAYGKKVADSPLACFASPSYLLKRPAPDRWIALTYEPAFEAIVPARRVLAATSDLAAAQLIRSGLGIGLLPCFLGDSDSGLRRVPGTDPKPDMDIWVLVHEDLRATPRVRVLMDHLYVALEENKDLIEGRRPI